jgi:hypothetical protein
MSVGRAVVGVEIVFDLVYLGRSQVVTRFNPPSISHLSSPGTFPRRERETVRSRS